VENHSAKLEQRLPALLSERGGMSLD
jgi:hypothetical protein